MAEAILAFYPLNAWSQLHTRQTKKTIHWVLQAIGSISAIAGMIIEFISRFQNSKYHFVSTHSIIGLIAGVFTIIGMLNGLLALWSIELKTRVKPIYLKFIHNLNGIAAFVLGKVFINFDILFYQINNSTIH